MPLFQREGDLIHMNVMKFYGLAAFVVLVGFGGGVAFASTYLNAQNGTDQQASARNGNAAELAAGRAESSIQSRLVGDARHSIGPADAPVTIVEFTDYDCPFCRRYYTDTFPQLMEKYGDRVRYVMRHFPLVSMHPQAAKAAEAAECAGEDGLFWEYHDLIMRGVPSLDLGSLRQYAADIGANMDTYDRCMEEGAKAELVQRDLRDGYMHGVRGTPSFFVNSYTLSGAQSVEMFSQYIDAALEDSGL